MIALIDYGMGNLGSVVKALEHVGGTVKIVTEPAGFAGCSGCLLPGVGHFADGMANLNERQLADPIRAFVAGGRPFLGICLGMQMLLDGSEEAPGVSGLGVIPGMVRRFPADGGEKIPHMGWNSVRKAGDHPAAVRIADGTYFYFVHSFYADPADPADTALVCDYILPFAAALGRKNIFATQFHPEKSQDAGLEILADFVRQSEK
jgi:glutamine amidotransferase